MAGADVSLEGEAGDDQIWGGDGDDVQFGRTGDDVLYGEAGRDYLEGGRRDTVIGCEHIIGPKSVKRAKR